MLNLVIREVKTKTTINYHYIHTRINKIKKTSKTKCCKNGQKLEFSDSTGRKANCYSSTWKRVWQFFWSWTYAYPMAQKVLLLSKYPTEMYIYEHQKLRAIAKNWELKWTSIGEWVNFTNIMLSKRKPDAKPPIYI